MYPEIHALQIRSSQVLVSVSSRVQLIFDLNTSSAISNRSTEVFDCQIHRKLQMVGPINGNIFEMSL